MSAYQQWGASGPTSVNRVKTRNVLGKTHQADSGDSADAVGVD